MDFDPAEIRKMMESRKRELRGKYAAHGEAMQSPTKRSRGEKENAALDESPPSPPKVQGFMAKFAVSPKNPRRVVGANTNNTKTTPTSKTKFTELSKRCSEMGNEAPPKRPLSPPKSASTTTKKHAPAPPASSSTKACTSSSEARASSANVAFNSSKRRAPSPPGSGDLKDRAPSPRATTAPKRWEVVERTAVTVRHTITTEGKNPASAKEDKEEMQAKHKDPKNITFAQAQAVARAREEANCDKRACAPPPKAMADPSEAKVVDKARNFEKAAEKERRAGDRQPTIPKSKVVPRGNIAAKVSQFDVGPSGPRCVIETKSLGSVSSRAKFFEKAMEDDRKAADAVYVPVGKRIAREIEAADRPTQARVVRPVVCNTQLSPTKKPLVIPQPGYVGKPSSTTQCVDEDASDALKDSIQEDSVNEEGVDDTVNQESVGESVNGEDIGDSVNEEDIGDNVNEEDIGDSVNEEDIGDSVNEEDIGHSVNEEDIGDSVNEEDIGDVDESMDNKGASHEQVLIKAPPPMPDAPSTSTNTPRKIGQVSNKLKHRLEEMMIHGHQTPDETILSVTECCDPAQKLRTDTSLDFVKEDDFTECSGGRQLVEDSFLTPMLARKSEGLIDDDTISRITGIPEDGHSTPLAKRKRPSSEESLTTPITSTMSQYRSDKAKTAEEREANVKRIVYRIPSNMMQELRKGRDAPTEEESLSNLEAYRRQIEEEILKQESIMKQTSHALAVCQENSDRGSEQHVEAERLLLISTQRHKAAQSELQRLNVQKSAPQSGGTLTLCDIKLPFKKEFLKLLRSCNNLLSCTHYFIVLVRSGVSLLHTELMSTNEKAPGGSVHLTHHMVLKNLQEGFRVFVEVYAVEAPNRDHPDYEVTMKKLRREKEKEQSANKGGILSAFTPSKKKPPSTPSGATSGSDDSVKVRTPSFGLIGRVILDESLISLDREMYHLDNYYSESPLDGRIVMKIQLSMPPKVAHCGMVRLKDSSGMFGSVDFIKSFFAAIEGGRLNLWNDIRDAEEEQEPLRSFDLSLVVETVQVDQSFNFFYFPVRMSNGQELLLLTYSEAESTGWAEKLNTCVAGLRNRKY
ncbi:hypothetical protein BIW11_10666 [Tropilaelaps mercedesae]|uniref:Anillin homology domain-containing protein n=1 Tax=Tropilaelaps mercedesae TaxID=418985 RepID=A0A1V9XEL0_9ACAR|nr:hypothetical protein BIW11_10666 [Tropilaelaps mercedesae]